MYLLRAKLCPFKSRDPQTGEMKDVGPRAWVEFNALPGGVSPEGDGEVSVKVIGKENDLDMDAAMAENARMEIEDAATDEKRAELREERAAEKARKEAEKLAALKSKHPEGWEPPDPDRDRLISLGWTPPAEDDAPPYETGESVPPEDPEDPRLLNAEGNALTLEEFVDKHDAMKKDEIVTWAEGLGIVAEGTKAEILGVIYAKAPAG